MKRLLLALVPAVLGWAAGFAIETQGDIEKSFTDPPDAVRP